MSMYTPLRNYQSPSRKGMIASNDKDKGKDCGSSNNDGKAHENRGASTDTAGTTGLDIRSSYSFEGTLRERTMQSQSASGDYGYRTYNANNSYYSATVPRQTSVLAVSGGLSIMSPMPPPLPSIGLPPRHENELCGISESRPSSPSSANDRSIVVKTPTFEYYGFVLYLVSLAAFVVYLLWAYLPNDALDAIGITYYPDRYWALALPAWWLTAVAFAYLFNMAANMYNTPLLNSIDNITDPYSNMPSDMEKASEFYSNEIGGIPPVSDLPISLVNRCLYEYNF